MPSTQIYMLETIVYKIELKSSTVISNRDNLCLNFKFAQRINFDIDTQYFSSPEIEDDSDGKVINMNYGKTFLFVNSSTELRQLLVTEPFQLTLYDGNAAIGSISVPWKKEFSEMVKFFETIGIVKSTNVEDWYEIKNEQGQAAAKVNLFIRMSCFGSNVQTTFQIKRTDKKQEYIFRQNNASRTFKVEKFQDDRAEPLVAPLYSAITDAKSGPDSQVNIKENVSLTALFDRDGQFFPKLSTYQGPDDTNGIALDFNNDDIVSMCFRPSENKFFDLLNMLSANVTTHEKGTCVTVQKNKIRKADSYMRSLGGNVKQTSVTDEADGFLMMTGDIITRKLCKNKDCPAVKKFKEYGIGPLATEKNLGTLYENIDPQVTYGMSHTYGTLKNYGPYGVFSRPKQSELPFVPPKSSTSLGNKNKKPSWQGENCPLCYKRLRGGSDNGMQISELTEENTNENENTLTPKSPVTECKNIMDQFDNILAEYKKALGPCGQATCPHAQTLTEEACKKDCEQGGSYKDTDSTCMAANDEPCDLKDCPYNEANKKQKYPSGCQNSKCAYSKYKLGLLDEDAELELQFLPPALRSNCGSPGCKYPLAPSLPPIHWDCPDPLPKGPCKNLNCPFQPPPLKKITTKQKIKTGPCGSPMCPYGLPQPCQVPTCPFKMNPCPMIEKQKEKTEKRIDEETVCKNPHCPFSRNISEDAMDGKTDDTNSKESKKRREKRKHKHCCNPLCPFNTPPKSKKDKKRKSSKKEIIGTCSNPDCMFNKDDNKKNKTKKCPSSESISICSDSECPYAELKKNKQKGKGDGNEATICSNPNCPEKKRREQEDPNLCKQPDCPYSIPNADVCDDPRCPYSQPLPSCGIPFCPYEPIPLRFFCKNEKCPSHSINFSKKNNDSKLCNSDKADENRGSSQSAKEKSTALDLQTTTVCEDTTVCDSLQECENPDCEKKVVGNLEKGLQQQSKKKGKRKKKGKFVYSTGDTYPGTKLGHKECVRPVFNVPPQMGWLWNIFTPTLNLKPRRGWRPGALTRTIAARLRAHRQAKGLGQIKLPSFKKDGTKFSQDEEDMKVSPKPTLQIQKKEGTYWITMNPLKDPYSLVENEDPYMVCTPMTFKITKNKKPEDDYCHCDGDGIPENSSSSSSDSELDIEFTPPAGIIHPERFKKKPNIVCCESQYNPKDFEVQKSKDDKGKKGKGKEKGKKGGKGGKGGKKKK